ncbi:fibronectin type III domain-containing protein [Roseivirga sp. BDSF3-8]|uniref:fibronectin type III domain-containing protein n=1 Tax=Roseivirga sp. BDSF3-8 TaxID=3241598 RepID=UPI00353277B5
MSYQRILFSSLFLLLAVQFCKAATDKYRLIIRDDPAYNMTIGWNQISGTDARVYYDSVDHGVDTEAYANSQSPDRVVSYKSMNNHFVRLQGLKPDRAYYFVIADSEGRSQRFWFKTLPDSPDKRLSIVAGGDSRRNNAQVGPHEPRISSNIMVTKLRPHFVAFGGDYTNNNTDGQWISWFDDWQYTIGDDGRMFPILPTRGNHERSNEDVVNLFDVASPDVVYAMNFAGNLVRAYTLNTLNPIEGKQTDWLRKDLAENHDKVTWRLAQYHHPIAPHQRSKSYKVLEYTHWAPLFYEYGMDLVIECDSHVAKVTWPVKPSESEDADAGFIRDDENGTIYTGEGSWGLTRVANVSYDWTRRKGSFNQVKWIFIDQEKIEFRTVKTENASNLTAVNDDDRFDLPVGLDIWEVEKDVKEVVINPRK